MHKWLLFLARGVLQDCSPLSSIFPPPPRPCSEEGLSATPPLLPPHPARAEPLGPWGQRKGRKGGPREGRSGWTASRHKYVWLSSHLLVGLTRNIVLFPHLLLSPKKLKSPAAEIVTGRSKGYPWGVMAEHCQQGQDWPGTKISGNWSLKTDRVLRSWTSA